MGSKAVDDLRGELDRLRQSLRDTDDNIRRLTGRESLFENRFRGRDNYNGPPAKRQNVGGVGNWVVGKGMSNLLPREAYAAPDSGDEDDLAHKPTIQSSVVAAQKESKSRQDIIEKQNSSEKDKARNRRMFGVLLGTLQQFKVEERQKEQQDKKRKAVERKLEEKQNEEKETLQKEKQQLFFDRREKQIKMKKIENKIELVQLHELWEDQTRSLMSFIRSNSKPHIFYMPKSHTEASLKKYEQSKAALEAIIQERRKQLEVETAECAEDVEAKDEDRRDKRRVEKVSRRNQKNDEEKMEVSDLEDDTGVNVDYGVSEDEENAANEKQKTEKSVSKENPTSPEKVTKQHSRDATERRRDEGRSKHRDEGRSRHKDEGRSRHKDESRSKHKDEGRSRHKDEGQSKRRHRRSSNRSDRKSENLDKTLDTSGEIRDEKRVEDVARNTEMKEDDANIQENVAEEDTSLMQTDGELDNSQITVSRDADNDNNDEGVEDRGAKDGQDE